MIAFLPCCGALPCTFVYSLSSYKTNLCYVVSVIKDTDLSTLIENYSDPLCAMSHKQPTNPSFLSNVTDGFWRNKQMPLHPHPYPLSLLPSPFLLLHCSCRLPISPPFALFFGRQSWSVDRTWWEFTRAVGLGRRMI